ncbi:hypothetical protein DUNSADRAFT_16219 [Dunaliella salina]|uniref:Encoded protein n=1 Tax=Dunaliella salina TaxID=3046 RepID=A0ABZ3KJI0_DUNSA|nr:hypothetical protein DUNSADRAFT_16219 [Dunaliella salina]|eukprot:KAF5829328.1 hypothetical protein DUNSADRAFT_16219 [Dunaliella salina]
MRTGMRNDETVTMSQSSDSPKESVWDRHEE